MAVRTAIDDVLEQAVQSGRVAGLVAAAADETGVIYEGAYGTRELGSSVPMSLDTVFWIASMTKAVTSVAAMQLVERGEITLDEPLGERYSELANPQVIERFDADGKPVIRPARGPITLRQLLTHTAGFSGAYWNRTMKRYMEENQIAGADLAVLGTPLVADPGTIWEYGISTDWVGQIVERISGQRLDAYFEQHIFGPLGMADSGFLMPDDQRSRLASLHQRQADGSLVVIPHTMRPNPAFLRGAGGLHSTARDYLRFLRALLHGGTLDGAQILRPETVAEMGQNQIGDIDVPVMRTASPMHSYDAEFYPGMRKKWGLAYFITTEDAPTGRSAGSLAWAGLFNTYYWLDPVKNVTGLILTQVLPFADPIVLGIFADFERAVYGL